MSDRGTNCSVVVLGSGLKVGAHGVARAKIADVVAAARQKTVTPWFKYYNGAWNEPGMNGRSSDVIPKQDMHVDAVYCAPLKKYIMALWKDNIPAYATSSDGITWSTPVQLFWPPANAQTPYLFFAGLDGASDDCNTVGSSFYMYFPDRVNYKMYRILFTIKDSTNGLPPSIKTGSGTPLAKTGFTFAGWNTAADGSGTNYAAGATYAVNAGLTLFAKWTAAASGALVWWKFDESSGTSAADSSGNGNTGTLTNMEGTDWTAGKIGKGLNFDGVNEYVVRTALSSSLAGDLTVSLWMKRNGAPASAADRIFDLATSTGAGLNMKLLTTSGYLSLDNGNGGNYAALTDNINVCDNAWHHVALTRTAAAPVTFKIYVDGVLRVTGNNAQNTLVTLPALYVGARSGGTSPFGGMLDDVRVYARALSGAEIQTLAQ